MDIDMLRGRKKLDVEGLLLYEHTWFEIFQGLRDGSAKTEQEIPDDFGRMMIKSSGTNGKTLTIFGPHKEPRTFSIHTALAKGQDFRSVVRQQEEALMQREEREFEKLETSDKTVMETIPAIPAERNLWEALKRTRSAAQVRRICRLSKHWLRFEWSGERNGKHWHRHSPSACPRALYDHAEKFCQAKDDDRYPRSSRSSSDDKRIVYLARVMAGLSLVKPIAPTTAVDLLRKRPRRSIETPGTVVTFS